MHFQQITITKLVIFIFFSLTPKSGYSQSISKTIDSLHKISISLARSNFIKGIETGDYALQLALKNNDQNAIAESYRIIGVNYHNANKRDSAINYYLKSLTEFSKINDQKGLAKVYNNLGNSYKYYNNNKARAYFQKTIELSKKESIDNLVGSSHLSIGTILTKDKEYKAASFEYYKALYIFKKINDQKGLLLTYQNIGTNQYYLGDFIEAKKNLTIAYSIAKQKDFINTLSSINLILAAIDIAKKDYASAQHSINEGVNQAKQLYDEKLIYDFSIISYELEKKQGNFKAALENLEQVHSRDSLYYKENVSNILSLHEEQQKSLEKQKQYEIQIEKQEKHTLIMIFAVVVAALSIAVIVILNKSKRKAERSNIRLKKLNEEISIQKENLNQINLKLEDIIAERTKDLTMKNQKLSEYSSHLSHQIRGPVATLKGLIMLAEEELINEKDYIKQMKKCVDDIDDQIMDINIALHDPSRKGLNKKNN